MQRTSETHFDPSTGWSGTSYAEGSVGLTIWCDGASLVAFSLNERDGHYLYSLEWNAESGFDAKRWNLSDIDLARYARIDPAELRAVFGSKLKTSHGDVPSNVFATVLSKLRK